MENNKTKLDNNPINNVGACWNKIGKIEDFMLMKITVNEPGNHTFVLFKNKNKGTSEDELYDKVPAWYIFPYKPKDRSGNEAS
jgi:hypothetical protein